MPHRSPTWAFALVLALLDLPSSEGQGKRPQVGQEVLFDSYAVDIKWLRRDKRVLLLQSGSGRLYRSGNGGQNWSDITSSLVHEGKEDSAEWIHVSQADPSVVLVKGRKDTFASKDAGLTWRRMALDQPFALLLHKTRPTWALVSHWTQPCSKLTASGICSHELFVTKDLGETFQSISSHVVQFSWGGGEHGHQDRVYFTSFVDKTKRQERLTHWMTGVDFIFTDNLGETLTPIIHDGNKFQVSHGYVLVVKVRDADKQYVNLMVSSNGGDSFEVASLPHSLGERSYMLLDASEGAVTMHVNHGRSVGDVYTSGKGGTRYSLSLTGNLRGRGTCAFEKVMNLNGIYLANSKQDWSQNVYNPFKKKGHSPEKSGPQSGAESGEEDQAGPAEGVSAGALADESVQMRSLRTESDSAQPPQPAPVANEDFTTAPRRFHEAQRRRAHDVMGAPVPPLTTLGLGEQEANNTRRLASEEIRTVVSFDMGAAWTFLKPPSKDSEGHPIACHGGSGDNACMLHLHDLTENSKFVPVYSYRNALGIVMGTGNVGGKLSFDPSVTNTYLSRDGGLTWVEAHKGTYIYEFGNHGGLLVIADVTQPSTTASFSWNEGLTWHEFTFSDKPVQVHNVLIEPDARATQFVLYGMRDGSGVLFHLNFDGIHERKCSGILSPGTDSSDYELWAPSDGQSAERCILGQHRTYTRRKRESECFNDEGTERPIRDKDCSCSRESYECEVGFTRLVGSPLCEPDSDWEPPDSHDRCVAKDVYYVEKYRKVSGDTCTGGWEPDVLVIRCPSAWGRWSSVFHHPLAIIGVIMMVGGVCTLIYLPRLERFFSSFVSTGRRRVVTKVPRPYATSAGRYAPPAAANPASGVTGDREMGNYGG